jgi:6-phosphogluconolactonase
VRDVVQSHLLQVVSLLAMEPHARHSSDALRDEKVRVLESARPLRARDLVRGQYAGYRSETDVAADSNVETYAALRLTLGSPRWEGVPFLIRAGKHPAVTASEVMVRLRVPPHGLFDSLSGLPNHVRFRLGPDRVSIGLGVLSEEPGEEMRGLARELQVCGEETGAISACDRLPGDALRAAPIVRPREPGSRRSARSGAGHWRLVQPGQCLLTECQGMEWITGEDVATAERAAAELIARQLAQAAADRGRATLALSGGRTPWPMFARLAAQELDWSRVHLFQVDERIAAPDDEARNWTRFLSSPLAGRIAPRQRHAMPVELDDPDRAAAEYALTLSEWAGDPPVLDVVHLGLGEDGHTASLFSGDPLLHEKERAAGVSATHDGYRRLSLTLPTLNRARCIVWYVTGSAHRAAMTRLFAADPAIVASRVERQRATCISDPEAAPRP